MNQEVQRVTLAEFMVSYKTLPKAPQGLNKKSDLAGLLFGKLLAVEKLEENFFGIKWRCRCLCTGTRDVWSKNLLRGVVADCGCRALWRRKKRRLAAKKKRQAKRNAELERRKVEKRDRRERNASIQNKRQALLKQTKAAAGKRWDDYRVKSTGENEPEINKRKAA